MKITRKIGTTLCTMALAVSMFGQNEPYKNTSLSPQERATDLVSRLTLEEKVALMQNASPAVPRLGIKPYEWWNEALHGVGRAGLATVFPQAIGMGASFDDALLYEVFSAVSDEARAKTRLAREENSYRRYQGLTFWTPNINIFRDPRWGRGQETYSEDPFHTGQMGIAVVRGLQGPEDSQYDKAHACAKHFAVHSGPEWNRHSFDAKDINPRDLWETYLPAFKDLIQKANVKEVMCAYNRYEGDPCCGSDRLLMQILREEWGFDGIVVSDCWAINDFYTKNHHETHENAAQASSAAVLSGTDLECGSAYGSLVEAAKNGQIKESDIDRAVTRLMKARFELGEMDESTPWDEIPASVIDSKKHQDLALEMARKSIVLLENENNILPLKKGQTIALIGPNANDSVMQWGNYNGNPSHTVTLLEAMKKYVPADQLIYTPACDRVSETSFVSVFDQCSTSKGQGFDVRFWSNNTLEGEADATIRQTTPVNFTTDGATAVASGIPLANFSGSYRATFRPKLSGKVDFMVKMRGACTLLIDGKEVANQERGFRRETALYTLDAQAGKSYDIELRYRHTEGRTASLSFDMGSTRPVDMDELLKKIEKADVVIFAGGIAPSLEGEEMPVSVPGFRGGDRETIQLPDVQRNVVKALKKAGKRVVFVNFSGSAMGLVPESENCEAIVQAWYPGQAGGTAIADVLMGHYNPAGRLPVTFYTSVEQLPDFQDYSMRGRTYRYFMGQPLYSFGYGLSYTTFEYGKAKLSKNSMAKDGTVTISVPVKNTGKLAGEEVVQVYIRRVDDTEGPIKSLKAFKRIPLKAGQAVKVDLELPAERFECFDEKSNSMRVMSGKYEIMYGSSSRAEDLQTISFVIK
ncbi:MAG: glycoside hydrolase family 3 C-terminal domain-containing protein [Bacteroidaceae bacterium]|nr:glycoside hydrolase family 3 C-terminal domain-containing protein [Bacteroidaceae bacterium]